MASSALTWALWLAKQGFLIAPLRPGSKRPLKGSWKERLSSDRDQIEAWFSEQPDMNYMVNPGTRFAIVDPDVKEGFDGREVFAELEAEYTAAPTLTVDTPRGGQHRYYRVDTPVGNAHTLPRGIDVRGEGGYVVGPGCHVDEDDVCGDYTVADRRPIALAPEWLADRMQPARAKSEHSDDPLFELDLPFAVERAEEFLRKRRPAVEGHNGNDHTYATLVQLRDIGISMDKALDLVLEPEGWNDRCEPPWSVSEITIIAENAYHYAKSQPGSKGGGLLDQVTPEDIVDISTMTFEEEEPKGPFDKLRPFVLRGEDIWKADTYQRMIIPEWLPDSGYVCLLAKRGCGKSTIMIDMASRIALDMDWHGWPVLEGYHVVYFCGEHDKVALQLLRAWREHNLGLDVANGGRLIFLRHAGDLLDPKLCELWVRYIRHMIGPYGKVIIFLDTWQRATSQASSQNDDRDMQTATHHAERMAELLGGSMVVAAHPPKGDEEVVLGSSIIENNSAAIWTLTNMTAGKNLSVTRMKGRGEGNYMLLDFAQIPLGEEDEHGREITGQAVDLIGGTAPTGGVMGPESGVQSPEIRMDEKRTALAAAIAVYVKHVRSEDGEAKTKPDINALSSYLSDISRTVVEDRTDIEQEVYDAGGAVLFDVPRTSRTISQWIRDCFIDPYKTALVEFEGEEWDVSFKKAGRSHRLQIAKAYKGS